MKMDQVAFYCDTEEQATTLKNELGLNNDAWITDKVTAESWVYGMVKGGSATNIALLQFNYQLGIEFEIIRYLSGPNWHQRTREHKFISHIGIHLDDEEDFPNHIDFLLVQETWTKSHTSEYLTTGPGAGRKYHYRIYEVSPGSYIKYIRRIHPK